jgi:hypothetical protein
VELSCCFEGSIIQGHFCVYAYQKAIDISKIRREKKAGERIILKEG